MDTLRTYTSDGSTVLYPIDFELGYLRKEYVYVYTGAESDFETQLDYTWPTDASIQLNAPLPAGEPLFIRRIIPRKELVNDYVDKSILIERNLNMSFLQALMILQEIRDGFYNPLGSVVVRQDVDFNGYRAKNLGDPVDDGDAVNYKAFKTALDLVAGDPDAVQTLLQGLQDEEDARIAADNVLQSNIDSINQQLTLEINALEQYVDNELTELQQQINTIEPGRGAPAWYKWANFSAPGEVLTGYVSGPPLQETIKYGGATIREWPDAQNKIQRMFENTSDPVKFKWVGEPSTLEIVTEMRVSLGSGGEWQNVAVDWKTSGTTVSLEDHYLYGPGTHSNGSFFTLIQRSIVEVVDQQEIELFIMQIGTTGDISFSNITTGAITINEV